MDPSRTPQPSEVEDDIIELTDIVERGSVPPAPGDTGEGDSALDSLMADLLTGSNEASSATEEEDFDLDALLKASGLDDEGDFADANTAAPAGGSAPLSAGAPAAPSDSADLGDVDALLRDLVAPEQPASPSAEAQAAAPADFEALLQSSVKRENTVPQAPAGDAGTGSEVDVDDLDSLLASIMEPETEAAPSHASAAPAPAADLGGLDGLDDLLGEPQPAQLSAGPDPEIPKKASTPAAAARQPAAAATGKAPAAGPAGDLDLDTLLGEAPTPAPPKARASASSPQPGAPLEADDDPLSGLDELLAEPENVPPVADAPAEADLGDPLLVGEADMPAPDQDREQARGQDEGPGRADRVSANIAAVQKKMADLAAGNGGTDVSAFNALRECVDDLAAEVRDLAESYASGLAAAEARISALEAELAAGGAPAAMSGDMARLEQRLEVVETSVEKAAAEAAARVIREEITALLAEMGSEV